MLQCRRGLTGNIQRGKKSTSPSGWRLQDFLAAALQLSPPRTLLCYHTHAYWRVAQPPSAPGPSGLGSSPLNAAVTHTKKNQASIIIIVKSNSVSCNVQPVKILGTFVGWHDFSSWGFLPSTSHAMLLCCMNVTKMCVCKYQSLLCLPIINGLPCTNLVF